METSTCLFHNIQSFKPQHNIFAVLVILAKHCTETNELFVFIITSRYLLSHSFTKGNSKQTGHIKENKWKLATRNIIWKRTFYIAFSRGKGGIFES